MKSSVGYLIDRFLKLKEERSAYVIAHYYQRPEVQDVADFVGDSYSMALAARETPCETILVAGLFHGRDCCHSMSGRRYSRNRTPPARWPTI